MYKNRPELIPSLTALYAGFNAPVAPFNVTGIRLDDNAMNDEFDDYLVFWTPDGNAIVSVATTIPGKWGTLNPVTYKRVKGAGRLVKGFYRNSHSFGVHARSNPGFAHEGFLQTGKLRFFRDVDGDGIINDIEPSQDGSDTGFNIHRASKAQLAEFVGKYSLGCQVSQYADAHEAGVALYKASMLNGNPISYLLSEIDDWMPLVGHGDVRQWIKGAA